MKWEKREEWDKGKKASMMRIMEYEREIQHDKIEQNENKRYRFIVVKMFRIFFISLSLSFEIKHPNNVTVANGEYCCHIAEHISAAALNQPTYTSK